MSQTLALDIDGVIMDFYGRMVSIFGENDNMAYSLEQKWPQHIDTIKQLVELPTLYENLEPISGAVETIRKLKSKYKIIAVTARPDTPEMITATEVSFYRRGIFLDDIVFSGKNKHDVLKRLSPIMFVDDKPENLLDIFSLQILPVLFSQPYNMSCSRFSRVKNWNELFGILSYVE